MRFLFTAHCLSKIRMCVGICSLPLKNRNVRRNLKCPNFCTFFLCFWYFSCAPHLSQLRIPLHSAIPVSLPGHSIVTEIVHVFSFFKLPILPFRDNYLYVIFFLLEVVIHFRQLFIISWDNCRQPLNALVIFYSRKGRSNRFQTDYKMWIIHVLSLQSVQNKQLWYPDLLD